MHLNSLLLLGAAVSLASALDPGKIEFCSEQGSTVCITEDVILDTCKHIPDSNAKGDYGSQVKVR